MKRIILSALAVVFIGGIVYSQQDSTKMNNNSQNQKVQKDKDNASTKDTNKSGKKKHKKTKTDSVNTTMDSTSR